MERREVPPQPYLELVGPVSIETGRNFYDQPPFDKITSRTEQQSSISQHVVRQMLSGMILANRNGYFSDEYREELHERMRRDIKVSSESDLKKRLHEPSISKFRLLDAADYVFTESDDYPHLFDYLSSKFNRTFHRTTGDFMQHTESRYIPIPTYPAWLEAKSAREQLLRAAEIQMVIMDVFPQQFGQTDLTEIARSSGKGPDMRRWRIIKGSGNLPRR